MPRKSVAKRYFLLFAALIVMLYGLLAIALLYGSQALDERVVQLQKERDQLNLLIKEAEMQYLPGQEMFTFRERQAIAESLSMERVDMAALLRRLAVGMPPAGSVDKVRVNEGNITLEASFSGMDAVAQAVDNWLEMPEFTNIIVRGVSKDKGGGTFGAPYRANIVLSLKGDSGMDGEKP